MLELILLLVISVITARLLDKRYKVASVAHAILFVFQLVMFLFRTDISLIRNLMISWMGEKSYWAFNSALTTPVSILNGGISGVLMLEFILFVFVPLLSIVAFVKDIKDTFKELKVRVNIKIIISYIINLVLDPIKDFKHNKNETYLILGKLLN